MTIQAIGTTGLALYLAPCDLRARGLTPEDLAPEQAVLLIREVCRGAGFPLPEPLELEVYPDKAGVLIFSHLHSAPPLIFSFPDLPSLLDGLPILPELPQDARAVHWQGRFFLLLPASQEMYTVRLEEFGSRERSPLLPAILEAQGEPLTQAGKLFPLYQAIRSRPLFFAT